MHFPKSRAIINKLTARNTAANRITGCSAVGSALDWGSRGREFKSRHSDQNRQVSFEACRFFFISVTYLGRKGAIEVNNIFLKLVEAKIEQFENDYINLSRQIFVDNNGKMIHPGEFGTYREKII